MFQIPAKIRILIIVQLCVGLSLLIWLAGYPFLGGYFKIESEKLLIESVMGKQNTLFRLDPAKAEAKKHQAEENQIRFDKLEEEEKDAIKGLFLKRTEALKAPFLEKIRQGIALLYNIPQLLLLWILLAVALPILLLLKKSFARTYIWLLPLVTLGYCLNIQLKGVDPRETSDLGLFPKESTLTEPNIKKAWDDYLIQHWSKMESTKEANLREGEFYFNLARIKRLPPLSSLFWEKQSAILLFAYLSWNCLFAWLIRTKLSEEKR